MSDAQLSGVPEQSFPLDEAATADAAPENLDYDAMSPDEERLIELVGFLVQGIVAHPEEVEVEEFFDEVGTVYGVRVHPEDIGRVIGREGRVASALRHVVKASATKIGTHVTVEILTEDGPEIVAQSAPEI
jgi:hypothetical protein